MSSEKISRGIKKKNLYTFPFKKIRVLLTTAWLGEKEFISDVFCCTTSLNAISNSLITSALMLQGLKDRHRFSLTLRMFQERLHLVLDGLKVDF